MSGYLVQLSPGREFLYRTPWEFRAAIESGEITELARIYHHASESWISIRMHPEFRRFEAEREVAEPADAPEEASDYPRPPTLRRRIKPGLLRRLQLYFQRMAASILAPARDSETEPGEAVVQPAAARPRPPARPEPRPERRPDPPKPRKPPEGPSRGSWTFYP
jgi:hypothetical protein